VNKDEKKEIKEVRNDEKHVKIDEKVKTQGEQGTAGTSTSTSSISKNVEFKNHALEYKHFTYINEKGQPKTTCAWVPKRN
jgi:hypothetical protein